MTMKEIQLPNITMEGVRIGFRNFSGVEGTMNKAGDRNFLLFIDEPLGAQMQADGWPVKYLKPRDEDDAPQAVMKVKLKYTDKKPPRVVMVTSRGRTNLGEGEVNILDWANIQNVDLIIRAYNWEFNQKTGIAAYVNAIYVTIEEDELERKYAQSPDSAQNCVGDDCPVNPWED